MFHNGSAEEKWSALYQKVLSFDMKARKNMKEAWGQQQRREAMKRNNITSVNVLLSKKAKAQLKRLAKGLDSSGSTLEQLLLGETQKLADTKRQIREIKKRHDTEMSRAKRAVREIYTTLEIRTRELSILTCGYDESSFDLNPEQRRAVEDKYFKQIHEARRLLHDARLAGLIPLIPTALRTEDPKGPTPITNDTEEENTRHPLQTAPEDKDQPNQGSNPPSKIKLRRGGSRKLTPAPPMANKTPPCDDATNRPVKPQRHDKNVMSFKDIHQLVSSDNPDK